MVVSSGLSSRPAYARAFADHYSANIMLYQERWAEALELYKGSVALFSQDPVRETMSRLYSLTCRSWLGEDVTSALELSQASILERFTNSPKLIAYTRFAVADAFHGAKESERCLRQIELALDTEPRAFYRGQLLEMKAASLRELGRMEEARENYQMIEAIIPESFVARRVQEVLQEMS